MIGDRAIPLLERSEFTASGTEELGEHLSRMHGSPVVVERVSGVEAPRAHYRQSRIEFGSFAIDQVTQSGDLRLTTDRLPCTVILWTLHGRVECDEDGRTAAAGPGEVLLLTGGASPVTAHLTDARVIAVTIAEPVFAGAMNGASTPDAWPVEFTGMSPVNTAMVEVWKDTVTFVLKTVLAEAGAATPMILGAAGRLLVGTALAVFPTAAAGHAGTDRDGLPPLLRSAMDFVDDNAGRNIGVADIARSVFVTPRRVQHVFKQHLQMTPTGYIREVRLRRAHDELLATDRTTTTVTATAARWRFAHMGRFAVLYRQTFGESPHETLRRGGPEDR